MLRRDPGRGRGHRGRRRAIPAGRGIFTTCPTCRELGVTEDVVAVLDQGRWAPRPCAAALRDAVLAAARGDFARAGVLHDELGMATLGAQSHLAAGGSAPPTGNRLEGDAELELALAFYRPRGASFHPGRAERLLAMTA